MHQQDIDAISLLKFLAYAFEIVPDFASLSLSIIPSSFAVKEL